MINSVSTTNLLQNFAVKQSAGQPKAEETKAANQPEIAQDIVKKETADAAKAYAAPFVAPPERKPIEKKSLNEFKADLIAQGKVEGKDFIVHIGELDSQLNIMENDKTVKVLRFNKDGATKEDFEAVQEFSYPVEVPTIANGKSFVAKIKSVETTYGADGDFHFRTTRYERESSPYKDELVNYDTKPFELIEKLKADGIKFASDLEFNENYMVNKVTAFNPKTNEVSMFEFVYDKDYDTVQDVTKAIIDADGDRSAEIRFRKDETDFIDFKNNVMYFDNKIPENLTREERIQYFKDHGGPGLKS